jgi:hypothetical protein
MHNTMQISRERVGVKAISSLLDRASSQKASSVETRLFTPHTSNGEERIKANHENYRR